MVFEINPGRHLFQNPDDRQGTAIYYFLIRTSLSILYSYHSWNPQYCIFHLTGGKQANGNFDQSLEGGGNF